MDKVNQIHFKYESHIDQLQKRAWDLEYKSTNALQNSPNAKA